MLDSADKDKLEKYIDKIVSGIKAEAEKTSSSGATNQQLIDRVTKMTVNKFTPESKMLITSVYNILMEKTLSKPIYQKPENKAAFYEIDILKQLNAQFVFDIPDRIDYRESSKEVEKWIACGAVVVVGGVISIPLKSFIPVAVAVVIAAIMAFVLKGNSSKTTKNIDDVIISYLEGVKSSMMAWIDSIDSFYSEKVKELEKGLNV